MPSNPAPNALAALRQRIDEIDRAIIALGLERLEIAEQIGLQKEAAQLPLRNEQREAEVIEGYREAGLEAVGRALIDAAVRRQEAKSAYFAEG